MIQPSAVRILDELGVWRRCFCGRCPATGYSRSSATMCRIDATVDGVADDPVLCLRRLTLDSLLVEAAARREPRCDWSPRHGALRDGARVIGCTPTRAIHRASSWR